MFILRDKVFISLEPTIIDPNVRPVVSVPHSLSGAATGNCCSHPLAQVEPPSDPHSRRTGSGSLLTAMSHSMSFSATKLGDTALPIPFRAVTPRNQSSADPYMAGSRTNHRKRLGCHRSACRLTPRGGSLVSLT